MLLRVYQVQSTAGLRQNNKWISASDGDPITQTTYNAIRKCKKNGKKLKFLYSLPYMENIREMLDAFLFPLSPYKLYVASIAYIAMLTKYTIYLYQIQ